jgi:hypothetical protein
MYHALEISKVGIKFGLDLLVDPENVGVMILRNNG